MLSAPDSALYLLESIPAPEKMGRADYAAYCLLLTEAEETLRAENLYNDQKIINEKEKMEQEHSREQYIITCLSFLSVFGFLFTVVLFLYQRKRKAVAVLAKEKQLSIQSALYQKSLEQIKDNEEQVMFLKSKLDALDQTENDSIKTRIDILEHENKSFELRQRNKHLQYEKLASSPVYARLKEGECIIRSIPSQYPV